MTWTSPRTFVTGEIETAAIFNTHLRDNLNFLRSGVYTAPTGTVSVGPTSGTTELTVATITPPNFDGSTPIELSFSWYNVTQTVSSDVFFLRLYDGVTQLMQHLLISGSNCGGGTTKVSPTPGAGSHTYTARLVRSSGTGTASIVAGSNAPLQLMAKQAN